MPVPCSLFLVVTVGAQGGGLEYSLRTSQSKPCQGRSVAVQGWSEEHRSGCRPVASDLSLPRGAVADPQPCLRHDGARLTLSRVMCGKDLPPEIAQ